MANGDVIDSGRIYADAFYRSIKLLDASVAADNGVWIDARGFPRMTVDIFGSFVATIQIHGSNEVVVPSNPTDGRQLGANVTAPGVIAIDSPVRWLKAKVSSYTSGTVNANINMASL